MRFATKVDRNVVKAFIQKDKTITCPIKGDYYALIDGTEILSALCVFECEKYYRIQGMRTEKHNRKKGYSSELLIYAMSQYNDKPIYADALIYSKNIFLRLGFRLIAEIDKGNHVEYQVIKEVRNGTTKN